MKKVRWGFENSAKRKFWGVFELGVKNRSIGRKIT